MLKKIYHKWKQSQVKKHFCRNAVFPKNTFFFTNAYCFNHGKKENIQIGLHCYIGGIFNARFGGKIIIGNNVYIGHSTIFQSKESITVGDNVIIADHSLITDNNNHPTSPDIRLKMSQCDNYLTDELWSWKIADSAPVVIEDNVWIGRDVRILKGVTVGRGSIVALGAIVTHDVPPYTIVAGNPARVVKELSKLEK